MNALPTPHDKTKGGAFRHRLSRDQGFTLVEVLIAMMLMVVVVVAVYAVWFGLQRSYQFTEDDMRAQQEARTALNEMVEFIRTARQPVSAPSDALDLIIVAADDNSLVCWTDVDRDDAHDLELVRFRVNATEQTLYRDTSQTGDSTFASGTSIRMVGRWLSNGDSLPLFTYTDASGVELSTPLSTADLIQIRAIAIDLRIDIEAGKSPIAHQLTSVVQPRNLRNY